jgi:hypothetical protein
MSLLPEDASYLEHVQAYFLAFRGDGVSLSPLDAALLSDWKQRGIPPQIVCRGIRKAAEALLRTETPGSRLRTLRACRATVEREYRRYEGLAAGRGTTPQAAIQEAAPETLGEQRLKKARAALRKALQTASGAPQRRGGTRPDR